MNTLDVKVLKSSIMSNTIPKFLIFVEEEPALAKQYIVNISNTIRKPYKYYDSADTALYDMTSGLHDECLYVITDDSKAKKDYEKYVKALEDCKENVILSFSKMDYKTEFFKKYHDRFVIFEKQDKYTLLSYAQRLCKEHSINVEQEKLLTLVEYCDCNLGEIVNELDKIFTLGQTSANNLMSYMIENGFSDYRQVTVQSFAEKAVVGNKEALKLLLRSNISAVEGLMFMYNKAKYNLCNYKNPYFGDVMELCCDTIDKVTADPIELKDDYALRYVIMELLR